MASAINEAVAKNKIVLKCKNPVSSLQTGQTKRMQPGFLPTKLCRQKARSTCLFITTPEAGKTGFLPNMQTPLPQTVRPNRLARNQVFPWQSMASVINEFVANNKIVLECKNPVSSLQTGQTKRMKPGFLPTKLCRQKARSTCLFITTPEAGKTGFLPNMQTHLSANSEAESGGQKPGFSWQIMASAINEAVAKNKIV